MIKTYSNEQRTVLKEVLSTTRNIAINATAGGGKTYLLVEIAKLLPSKANANFLAFNKIIVEELAERLPSGFDCMTLHSLGLKALYQNIGSGVKLSDSKYRRILAKVMDGFKDDIAKKEYNTIMYTLLERWDWHRVTLDESLLLTDPDPKAAVEDKVWAKFLQQVEKANRVRPKRGEKFDADFTDMIYLPVKLQFRRMPTWDHILLDESQDLNNCQHALVDMIIDKGGRLISVGDDEQCIYAFAGSNPLSFKKFGQRPNTVELPLSVTYRCAKAIVDHARQYSVKITAHPDAPEGEVREGTLDEVRAGDFVLCRNNAPLLDAYFNLLAEDKKAYIVGKDTREAYIKMVKPFERSHMGALMDHWDTQLEELHDKLLSFGIRKVEKVESYQQLQERILGLEIIASKCSSVKQMAQKIEQIFEPSKDSIALSTVHKAKGLEAERVFLLRWDLMFSRCETETEMAQERNLAFVAVTRAKSKLVYIYEPDEEKVEAEDENF